MAKHNLTKSQLTKLILEQTNQLQEKSKAFTVGGYEPQHFDICPGAKTLYSDIVDKHGVEEGLAEKSAKLQDKLFALEKEVLKSGASKRDVEHAKRLASAIMLHAHAMDLTDEHGYISGHVDAIRNAQDKDVDESIFDTPRMGGFHNSKGVAGHNADTSKQDKAYSDSNKAAASDAQKEYVRQFDILKNLKKAKTPKDSQVYKDQIKAVKDAAQKLGLDLKDLAEGMQVLALPAPQHDQQAGDIEVGHTDNEPLMVRRQVYDIAVYAAKLHKKLAELEQSGQEIDFPSWWQAKVTIAREHISKAQHYLEFGDKEDLINQLALESKLNEVEAKPIPSNILLGYNANIRDVKTMAQAMLSVFDQLSAKETIDFERGSFNQVLKLLNRLAGSPGDEEEELNEAGATCCHRCGRVHVKGSGCKKPYIKESSPRHCKNKK